MTKSLSHCGGAEATALLCHSTDDGFCASDMGFGESSGPMALAG